MDAGVFYNWNVGTAETWFISKPSVSVGETKSMDVVNQVIINDICCFVDDYVFILMHYSLRMIDFY